MNWPWQRHRNRAAGTITADRNSVVITIRKDALPVDPFAPIDGVGDWGGVDYPEFELTSDCCTALLRAAIDGIQK